MFKIIFHGLSKAYLKLLYMRLYVVYSWSTKRESITNQKWMRWNRIQQSIQAKRVWRTKIERNVLFYFTFYYVLENRFKTFIDTLLEASENDPQFTNVDVRDEVLTMMFAVKMTTNCFQNIILTHSLT